MQRVRWDIDKYYMSYIPRSFFENHLCIVKASIQRCSSKRRFGEACIVPHPQIPVSNRFLVSVEEIYHSDRLSAFQMIQGLVWPEFLQQAQGCLRIGDCWVETMSGQRNVPVQISEAAVPLQRYSINREIQTRVKKSWALMASERPLRRRAL